MRNLADLHERLRSTFSRAKPAGEDGLLPQAGQPGDQDFVDAGPRAFLESQELLSALAVVRSIDGVVLAANSTFLKILGAEAPEGRTLEDLGLPLSEQPLASPRDIEISIQHEVRVLSWQDVLVRDSVSGEYLVFGTARDVTEDLRLEQAREEARLHAEEASRAKSRQLATVVHELRTPLNGILGMSHLLQQTGLTPEQRNYIAGISQAGSALAQLVDDLLDFSTIEAGRFRLNSRAENIRQLLESVVEMLAPRAHQKGIELGATVAFDVPNLMDFDPARLRQVLFNVIGNAVKFTKVGGVLVRVRLNGRAMIITVADTGPGMSAEARARIFEEFEQVGTAAERSGGTGLGLSISSRILREFGGRLSVESEEGVGTTFTIELPAISADMNAGGNDRMLLLRSSHVLLLAPDGPAAQAIISTIETLGGRCRHAASAEEAEWTIANLTRKNLAFTDMIVDHRVPGVDLLGPVAQKIRRILLVSPEERSSQRWDAYDAWLIRPLREQSLVDVLRGRLGGMAGRMSVEVVPSTEGKRLETGLSVLLAEDDPVSAMMVGAILRKAGCIVHHVTDLEGLRQAALMDRHTDLIISDLHMPGGDLADVLPLIGKRAASNGEHAPVLVLSGETDPLICERVIASGASCVLQKPIDPRRLLAEIDTVLRRTGRKPI